eukprot:3815140-Amphidinium_carterae.1
MSAVILFQIFTNTFEGALPESGLQAMRAVWNLNFFNNGLTGTLPEIIRTMSTVWYFRVDVNSFEGALPASGLQGMQLVGLFSIEANGFKG